MWRAKRRQLEALPVREGSSAVDLEGIASQGKEQCCGSGLEHGFVGRLKRAFHGRITEVLREGGGVNQEKQSITLMLLAQKSK